MKVVNGVDLEREYSFDEIMDMNARGTLKPIALQGYVVQASAEGKVGFVPWHRSIRRRMQSKGAAQYDIAPDVDQMREEVEQEFPMVRRTPQQRVASMVVRLMAEAKRNGTIAGLTDAQIKTITGEAWKTGENNVTEDMVRKVAAHFLGVAEIQNREADSRRVTRAHPFA